MGIIFLHISCGWKDFLYVYVCMHVCVCSRGRNFYSIATKFGTQVGLVKIYRSSSKMGYVRCVSSFIIIRIIHFMGLPVQFFKKTSILNIFYYISIKIFLKILEACFLFYISFHTKMQKIPRSLDSIRQQISSFFYKTNRSTQFFIRPFTVRYNLTDPFFIRDQIFWHFICYESDFRIMTTNDKYGNSLEGFLSMSHHSGLQDRFYLN